MNITGRITQNQIITGAVKVTSDISGAVGDVVHISGTISRQTKRLTGIVKNPSHVHGIISKPSYEHGKSDHKFITVDLVKFNARLDNVPSVCAIVPFSSAVSQTNTGNILIDLSPATISINQVTAVTDTEAYNNVNP